MNSSRSQLEEFFRAGLEAVQAQPAVARALERDGGRLNIRGRELPGNSKLVVVAVGKAAAAMAMAVENVARDRIRAGIVVTKDHHAEGHCLTRCEVIEAAHPIPDVRGEAAARAVLRLADEMRPDDLLLVLLSGGGSALLSAPVAGLGREGFAETQRLLLASGADIHELNTVRKHLSLLSGGRLAQAAKAQQIEVLAVSDVPGDREEVIASGPCSADPGSFGDALAVLARFDLMGRTPAPIVRHLEEGARGLQPETLKPGDPLLERVRYGIVARNADALRAAAECARAHGLEVEVLEGLLEGEARRAGRSLIERARTRGGGRPVCLIAGGETTVRVRGGGRGGRNQELALAAALELQAGPVAGMEISLLAAGSDGSDGPTPAAGAFADASTVERGRQQGVSAQRCLAENDSHRFFEAEGGLLVTGPTGTNVMDLALVIVDGVGRPATG